MTMVSTTITERAEPAVGSSRRKSHPRRARRPDRAPAECRFDRNSLGWLTATRPVAGYAVGEHLSAHADWPGPVKLVRDHEATYQRIDFFLGKPAWAASDRSIDEEAAEDHTELAADLEAAARGLLTRDVDLDSWQGPPAEAIVDWLVADGRTAAVDRDGNIRLTIHRPACDGQVCFQCRPDRLQIVMTLGTWQQLAPSVEAAMLRLADEANARTRLVRIAWLVSDDKRRCVAQVDLTGLPGFDEQNAANHAMWRGMIEMGLAGLELVLRRLGRELSILAQGAYAELARAVGEEDP
jgi:hypothetical protein